MLLKQIRQCENCGEKLNTNKYHKYTRKSYCLKLECKLSVLSFKEGNCIRFTGAVNPKGYRVVIVSELGNRKISAHRAAIALHLDDWSILENSDIHVLHHPIKCKFRDCIKPSHLRLGTNQENQDDRKISGTTNKGERNGRSILTPRDVKRIRRLLKKGIPGTVIGPMFGVSPKTISNIRVGTAWV